MKNQQKPLFTSLPSLTLCSAVRGLVFSVSSYLLEAIHLPRASSNWTGFGVLRCEDVKRGPSLIDSSVRYLSYPKDDSRSKINNSKMRWKICVPRTGKFISTWEWNFPSISLINFRFKGYLIIFDFVGFYFFINLDKKYCLIRDDFPEDFPNLINSMK